VTLHFIVSCVDICNVTTVRCCASSYKPAEFYYTTRVCTCTAVEQVVLLLAAEATVVLFLASLLFSACFSWFYFILSHLWHSRWQ